MPRRGSGSLPPAMLPASTTIRSPNGTSGGSPSGGPGKTTSVFLRGANANHTLVLVDGVRAGDPSQVNGAPNFAHFLLDNVDRIEVVRGPMSTLYGSDA